MTNLLSTDVRVTTSPRRIWHVFRTPTLVAQDDTEEKTLVRIQWSLLPSSLYPFTDLPLLMLTLLNWSSVTATSFTGLPFTGPLVLIPISLSFRPLLLAYSSLVPPYWSSLHWSPFTGPPLLVPSSPVNSRWHLLRNQTPVARHR